jgi:glutathionyl-hydroquinone reductase
MPRRRSGAANFMRRKHIMLVDGKWTEAWQPVQAKDKEGRFVRQQSSFRNWVTADGSAGPTGDAGYKAEVGRYHLYVALICPWASRTLMARKLKKLEDVISVDIVEPVLSEQGWKFGAFPSAGFDTVNGATYMHEIYTKADPHYTGRATVPVLFDKQRNTIVSNESADIVRMLNLSFGELADNSVDLYPADLALQIDALNEHLYHTLNNGVYKAGFASTQQAYEEACVAVFKTLDELENRLGSYGPYLFGNRISESDIRLFVTLIRFDAAYHGLFKCNLRRIADYPRLKDYMKHILDIDGIASTVNLNHIKAGYYSIKALNPSGIVPLGPS